MPWHNVESIQRMSFTTQPPKKGLKTLLYLYDDWQTLCDGQMHSNVVKQQLSIVTVVLWLLAVTTNGAL